MKKEEDIYSQQMDYRSIILHFFKYKYLFISCLIVLLAIAFLYNKMSKPVYQNKATILVNKKNSGSIFNKDDFSGSFGQFYQKNTHEDELAILQSYFLVNNAITKVNGMISYFKEESIGGVEQSGENMLAEIYSDIPFEVKMDKTIPQPMDVRFRINFVDEESYRIVLDKQNVWLYDFQLGDAVEQVKNVKLEGSYRFDEIIQGPNYRFKIEKRAEKAQDYVGKTFYFSFNNLSYLTMKYASALKIESTDPLSSIFTISMKGDNPQRITDFLNALVEVYVEQNLSKKNSVVENTIKFIDKQISNVSDSLVYTEDRLQNFRSKNKVTNLSFQGERIYDKMNELESQKAVLMVAIKYYNYIIDYFKRNTDASDLVAPASMGVEDNVLNKLISDLTQLYTERAGMLETGKSIFLEETDDKIKNTKSAILENVRSNARKLQLQVNDINRRIANLNAEIEQLPKTERELFGIERKFKLNDAIYTFLLEKRSNAQIAKASNVSDYEIIDPAREIMAKIVSPKKRLNYLIAIFLGLFLPILFILVKDFFRRRINSEYGSLSISKYPIISEIKQGSRKKPVAIIEQPTAPVADSIRHLATHLAFENDVKNICVSSANNKEGKTYVAINLALALAEMGKRTLLIDADFRRPSIDRYLELNADKGLSAFIKKESDFASVVQADYAENLDVIILEEAVDNPMNLAGALQADAMPGTYDYVIYDCSSALEAPESYLLMKKSDLILYILRDRKSLRKNVEKVLADFELKKLSRVCMVLNAVK